MAGGTVCVTGSPARRRQEGRKTRAHEVTHSGIGRSTVLSSVTVEVRNVRRVHHFGDMRRVIRPGTHAHARGMSGSHRCHHGDREYGKHGDEACEHALNIGTVHENVHCHSRRVSGENFISA